MESTGGLIIDPAVLQQPQPWMVNHRGLEYKGEVIFAETVDPAMGLSLEGDLSFSLVLFSVPRRISPGLIQDPGIAMAVPKHPPERMRQGLGGEIRAIRETRERYRTTRDPDTMALRRATDERELSLKGEMASLYAMGYSAGRIYTYPRIRMRPRDVFAGDSHDCWADRLVTALLGQAFPTIPIDGRDFPRPLADADMAALHRDPSQNDPDAMEAARSFGPGLGLSRRDAAGSFAAAGCQVVALLRAELESRGGEMTANDVLAILTRGHGLPRALVLLYLLAAVRQLQAEVELQPDHRLESSRGGRFWGDRITWDLVPDVTFDPALAERCGTVRLQPEPAWSGVLPQRYSDVVAPVTTCTAREDEMPLSDVPFCSACRLQISDEVPLGEIEETIGAVEEAMREYNRRLASEGFRRVLASGSGDQLARFIDLVHVADPSALSSVLDDEVVEFLRGFLKSG